MKIFPENVLELAKGSLYNTFLHSFNKTLYYMVTRVRSYIYLMILTFILAEIQSPQGYARRG